MIIYMKAHVYLYAGVSLFVCRRMIFYLQTQPTTAQQASGPDTGEQRKRHRKTTIHTAVRAYRHQTGTTGYKADNWRNTRRNNVTT